jgi:hypothetical protein
MRNAPVIFGESFIELAKGRARETRDHAVGNVMPDLSP